MDSSQTSSFIPKTPVRGAVAKRKVRKVYVFTYLIYIFFLGTLIAAGVMWFFKLSAENELSAVQQNLAVEKGKFNQSNMAQVIDLDDRMNQASRLLSQQISLASVFTALEQVTVAPVSLTGFKYEKAESATLELALRARTNTFNAALYQRQVLASNPVLAGATVTDVQYGQEETAIENATIVNNVVTFTISKALAPSTVPVVTQPLPTAVETTPEEPTDDAAVAATSTPVTDETTQ